MFRFMAAAVLALLAGACTSSMSGDYAGSNGKTLIVRTEDWQGYRDYLGKVGGTNAGAFVVPVIGGKTAGYAWNACPASDCIAGKNYVANAMQTCRQDGSDCVLFAQSSTIVVNYKVADGMPGGDDAPSTGSYGKGSGNQIVVAQNVWAGYQHYLVYLAPFNTGAFVVKVFGGRTTGYSSAYCSAAACPGTDAARRATATCSKDVVDHAASSEKPQCVLFARSGDIVVDYRLQNQ